MREKNSQGPLPFWWLVSPLSLFFSFAVKDVVSFSLTLLHPLLPSISSLHTDTSIRTFNKMLFNALLSTAKRVGTCSFSTSSRFALSLFYVPLLFSSQPTLYFKNARTMTMTNRWRKEC